jgi:enoyl-CoA hydratase
VSFTSQWIDAATAKAWGLLVEVVEPEELMDAAKEIAEGITANDGKTVALFKHLLQSGLKLPLGDALRMERATALEFYKGMGDVGANWQSKL